MVECPVPTKRGIDPLTIAILTLIAVLTVLGVVLTPRSGEIITGLGSVVDTLLNVSTYILYILGGGVIVFGASIAVIHFLQCKIRNPYQPSCATRFLSGYLTLSLEFFIGAEIIKTVVTRTVEEFSLLILVIISRGLFSLILYLERRWHGAAETE